MVDTLVASVSRLALGLRWLLSLRQRVDQLIAVVLFELVQLVQCELGIFVSLFGQQTFDEVIDVGGTLLHRFSHVELEVDAQDTERKVPDQLFNHHVRLEVLFVDRVLHLEVQDESSAQTVQQGGNRLVIGVLKIVHQLLLHFPHLVRVLVLHGCHEVTEVVVFNQKWVG